MAITEEAERAAKEVLYPPSPFVTGEEQIFTSPGYLSLQGNIEKVSAFKSTIEYLVHYPGLLILGKCKLL